MIRKDDRVIPNRSNISLPAAEKMIMITRLKNSALAAILRLTLGSSSAVSPRNTGVLAMGFMMAKKPMNTVKA